MKTIYLYTPYWSSLGGGEKYMLALAEVLSQVPEVAVSLLVTDGDVKKSELERFFNVNLSNVSHRILQGGLHDIKRLTRDVDVFICLSNFRRVRTSARSSVQVLQVPYGKITAASVSKKIISAKFKEAVKDFYRLQLLSYAETTATLVVTYSKFVSNVLFKNFGIHSHVLYPPIQDFFIEGISKKEIILSVGRFFSGLYNDKRYDILTEAFRNISQSVLQGWEYHIVGSCTYDKATKNMLESLRNKNKDFPIYFHVNEPYETLRRLYNEATIFWHAAGFGIDEANHPENVEHFGMTTVEAMSAGCIPVVINRGGQKEIVQHGVNGFLWNTIDELLNETVAIAQGKILLMNLQENARKRFVDFSISHFQQKVIEIFSPLMA